MEQQLTTTTITGKLLKIPSELEIMADSLDIHEKFGAQYWWENLNENDKSNVALFLRTTYDDFGQRLPQTKVLDDNWFPYVTLYAIGSTARLVKEYNDIDFLLITNLLYGNLGRIDPQPALESNFNYQIQPTIFEKYRFRFPAEEDEEDRIVISLTNPGEKRVHLTLQPEIPSELHWQEFDEKEKIVLYRITTSPYKLLDTNL